MGCILSILAFVNNIYIQLLSLTLSRTKLIFTTIFFIWFEIAYKKHTDISLWEGKDEYQSKTMMF